MFKGRKTGIFWKGLLIFGVAVIALFYSVWNPFYTYLFYPSSSGHIWGNLAPFIFGSVVFMFIGLYMMKSGVVEEESAS